ncbi:MAG: glycoside hydrolase family 15 protein [Nitrososphaerales archaeon]
MELLGSGTPLQGIVGNGRLTACVLPDGNVSHIFWPHVGYPQHLKESATGLSIESRGKPKFAWLDDKHWSVAQRYLPHSNVIETIYEGKGLRVSKQVFVDPQLDVLVCIVGLAGIRDSFAGVHVLQYQNPELGETPWGDAAFYDAAHDSVVHYYMDTYFAFGATERASSYQCGVTDGEDDARSDCEDGSLKGRDAVLHRGRLGVNSALAYDVGSLVPGRRKHLGYFAAVGHTRAAALSLIESARSFGTRRLLERTMAHGASSAGERSLGWRGRIGRMVERSILVLKLLSDRDTGGIIACPSTDPDYRYVWPRDAFYAALALDAVGQHGDAGRFYRWCTRAQDRTGVLHQRYFAMPELVGPSWGPSWGEEIDETAAVVWGAIEHFGVTADKGFLTDMWPFIEDAAWYLADSVDRRSGTIGFTMNPWEEHPSKHIYSAITTCAGLGAAAKAATRLNFVDDALQWRGLCRTLRTKLLSTYWSEELGCFIRSADPRDERPDISSLAMSFPFGIVPVRDPRMAKTADKLVSAFRFPTGGVGRYPGDDNYGGNPWIISACWLAVHYSKVGDQRRAGAMLNWCLEHATGLGLLPEQVEKATGAPLSAIPLAWSHAMFILAAQQFIQARR